MRKLPLAILCTLACGLYAYAGPEPIPSGKEMKQAVVPTPECDYTWTGFYIGGRLGYGWDAGHVTADPLPDPFTFGVDQYRLDTNSDGIVGGGEAGYNWQFGKWFVLGAEADFSGSGMNGDHYVSPLFDPNTGNTFPGQLGVAHDVDWFGTVRGRIGIVPFCRLMVYGTGGFAYAHSEDVGDLGAVFVRVPYSHFASHDGTDTGWTVGGGLEYAISKHWSIKAEYLYVDCGDHSATGVEFNPVTGFNLPFAERYHWETKFHTVTAGINFKF